MAVDPREVLQKAALAKPSSAHLLKEVKDTTDEMQRIVLEDEGRRKVLTHRLQTPLLRKPIKEFELHKALYMEHLPPTHSQFHQGIDTDVVFPGIEIKNWPQTVGQVYAVSLVKGDGIPRTAFGISETSMNIFNTSLNHQIPNTITHPEFKMDQEAIKAFVEVLREQQIPLLVAFGALGVVTGGDFLALSPDSIREMMRSNILNRGNKVSLGLRPSPQAENEEKRAEWSRKLLTLHEKLLHDFTAKK